MYVYRNNEVRSRDHRFRGKAKSIIYVLWKIRHSMLTDAQINKMKLIAAFWNFVNPSKNDQTKSDKTRKNRKLKKKKETLSGHISVNVTGKYLLVFTQLFNLFIVYLTILSTVQALESNDKINNKEL